MRNEFLRVVTFTLVVVFLPLCLSAQPLWTDRGYSAAIESHNNMLTLEVQKAEFDVAQLKFVASWWYLSLRIAASQNLIVVGEVPFGYVKTKELSFQASKSANHFGNPYVGLEIHRDDSRVFFETGARFPVIPRHNQATIFGMVGDIDRMEAWSPDALTLYGTLNLSYTPAERGLYYRLRGGPSLMLLTGKGGGTALPTLGKDSDLFLIFSGQAGFEGNRGRLGAGITGRARVTRGGNIGRRTFLQLGFNAALKLKRWRPGLHFRIPLDKDLREVLDYVAGVNIGYLLNAEDGEEFSQK